MDQVEARKTLSQSIEIHKATLLYPKEGQLKANTPIGFLCGKCGEEDKKQFKTLTKGPSGALCTLCTLKQGNERRIESLNSGPKWNINNGETNFDRALAERTAAKNGSTLLGVYQKETDGSYIKIIDDNRIKREHYLHIKCGVCDEEDYVYFYGAYGAGATKRGEGLCLCTRCRKGYKAEAARRRRRGNDTTFEIVIESMPKRADRIERDGQECTDCKQHKSSSEFFADWNDKEKCKVYTGRCYPCRRKLRTSNKEDALRNGSVEDFIKMEMKNARDRNKGYNKKHPDDKREFSITVPYLMELLERQDGKCALSGLRMLTTTHRDECPEDERRNPNKLSIDRIDSLKGYIEGNVQLVRWRANSMKLDTKFAEYKEEIRLQYEHLFGVSPANHTAQMGEHIARTTEV